MSNRRAVVDRSSEPASLYRVMQAMIGEALREHYEVPQKMSHELFMLLMQMNAEIGIFLVDGELFSRVMATRRAATSLRLTASTGMEFSGLK